MRFLPAILLVPLVCGCSTPSVLAPGGPVDPKGTYTVVYPKGLFGRRSIWSMDIELTRVDSNGQRRAAYYKELPAFEPTVLLLEPGFYYLSGIRTITGSLKYNFDWQFCFFEVKPGQLNYPGSWQIVATVVSARSDGTVGAGSAEATFRLQAHMNDDEDNIREALMKKFPNLAAVSSPKNVRIQVPDRFAR